MHAEHMQEGGRAEGDPCISQDDRLAVAALWQPSLLWMPPAWLTAAAAHSGERAPDAAAVVRPGEHGDACTETSSSSGTHADGGCSSGDEAGSGLLDGCEPGDRRGVLHPQETEEARTCVDMGTAQCSRESSSSDSSSSESDSPSTSRRPWQAPADVFGELDMAFAGASGPQSRRRALDLLQRGTGRPADAEPKAALEAEFAAPAAGDNPVHVRTCLQTSGGSKSAALMR